MSRLLAHASTPRSMCDEFLSTLIDLPSRNSIRLVAMQAIFVTPMCLSTTCFRKRDPQISATIHWTKALYSNLFKSVYSAFTKLQKSTAKPLVTYAYGNHPYPASPQLVPHELRIFSAPF